MTKETNVNLTNEQRKVMFEESTEPPGSSKLNHEKREGYYNCANCGVKLFQSSAKLTDHLVACGELMSTHLFAQILRERGVSAVRFDIREVFSKL